jgi:hypothetical protein
VGDVAQPVDLWWSLLAARLGELRSALPVSLKGTIQLCAPGTPQHPTWLRYIQLNGPSTVTYEGVAQDPEVWIDIREDELSKLLREGSGTAFRSAGRHELWAALFEALNRQGRPKSWLQIRGHQ